ncbi:MAG: ATP-dependent DNA helicase RecG, partial [Armatimonadetes bacterium]|nr:ATP-dependent DNA helicase RecG [Armatimonadota bacterium]
QRKVIEDVIKDMSSGSVMNRLLQGDVGSGKTVVAMAAMLCAAMNGCQAALMVPTEILAQQHAMVFRQLLADSDWQVELATGGLKAREKRLSLARLADGSSSFAIGTHALIQEGVEFRRLALVVVDEQHRFGVLQRQALQLKGDLPHVLMMTATPIPRTLTMTLYGDLDVSVLNEMPPNRPSIRTYWRQQGQRSSVYQGLQKLLDQGRQAYTVCPLVEQSERLQARAARELAEEIAKERLPGYRIGLLHGQMSSSEKEKIMLQFRHHDLDVLVATSVIEVGVDVPNATAIIIENAERFGLSQLHQLRGRVGRGRHPSYCILLADPQSDDAFERLQVMAQTTDGFKIAEEDLRIRGAGEFFGVKQSGAADLRLGNLITDVELLEESRQSAVNIVETDPALARWPELRKAVAHLHPSTVLATVG